MLVGSPPPTAQPPSSMLRLEWEMRLRKAFRVNNTQPGSLALITPTWYLPTSRKFLHSMLNSLMGETLHFPLLRVEEISKGVLKPIFTLHLSIAIFNLANGTITRDKVGLAVMLYGGKVARQQRIIRRRREVWGRQTQDEWNELLTGGPHRIGGEKL
ncbi:hypothetical protein Tco_1221422 [Tanacetum coccineum]